MPKVTAVYVRESSKQRDQRSQESDLARWAEGREGEVVRYQDTFTGESMERPGMDRLMADIRAGEVATVVVWRLDRLGRTSRGLTALLEELRGLNVNLVSLEDRLDSSTPAGRLMANVLASVAAYETEVRAERVLAGQRAARAAGKKWGGSKKGRRLKVSEEQVAAIRRMHAEGGKIAAIARATGLSRPTVYRLLEEVPERPGEPPKA